MKLWKRILSVMMIVVFCLTMVPISGLKEIFSYRASAASYNVCLSSLQSVDFDRYTGNLGDSFFYNLNKQELIDNDRKYYRNGNIGVDESVYENGFEVWIARWNNSREISWAAITYDIDGMYDTLSGSTGLIKSYNTNNFDTTVYFYGDDQLLHSQVLTNDNYKFDFNIDVKGVNMLKILVQDNVATYGGTSFALYDLFLSTTKISGNTSGTMANGICGDNLTWTLYNDGELVISGNGQMYHYVWGHPEMETAPWYEYRIYIKKIIVDTGVSSIGSFAFDDCYNLESVELADTVKNIDIYAFCNCLKLKSFSLPEMLEYIGSYAFGDCDNLLIDFVDNILKKLSYVPEGLFADCDNIENLVIPDNISEIELCAFESCDKLTSVTIPYSVTYIGLQAFYDCDNINTVYYTGSEAQWNSIEIEQNNEDLTESNIIFNFNKFNKNTYKADIWLDLNPKKETQVEHTIVTNIMQSTGNMSDNYIEAIESDKGFMVGLKWTQGADIFFNLTDGTHEYLVRKKELYESLLFDMMKMKLDGDSFQSDFAAELIDEYKKVESVFSTSVNISGTPFDIGREFMELKKGNVNIDDYSKALFNNQYINSTFDSLDDFGLILNNILKFADTIEDFYTKMSSYVAAKKMTVELKTFFTEIGKNATDEKLCEAAEELVLASESILDALNIATEDAAFDMSLQMADIWIEVILSEIPGLNMIVAIYEGLGAVHDTTKLLSDIICASESNRNAYYLIKATAELCNTSKKAMKDLAYDYINNRTETDALNFIEAINLHSILKIIECKAALSFYDSVCNKGVINKNIKMGFNTLQFIGVDIENPREVLYSTICENAETLLDASQKQLYFLSSSWLLNDYNLKSDYPEVYNYYIAKELEYPEYADSYKPVLYFAELNNDFSAKFYTNSLKNIDGIEIREYSDKSQDNLLNTYIVPNEKEILYSNLDKTNEFPRTYTVSGYFDAADGTDADKIYSSESNSKTLGNFQPIIWLVLSSYEEKSAKIMIFDKTSSDLDIVYNLYRKEDDGDYIKISSFDKNTGLLGWFNNFTDYNLSEDVVYTYCVQSEVSFSNGIKILSDMSNIFSTKITKPAENNQNEVDIEVVLLNEPTLAMYSMRSNNQATSVSTPVGINLSWQESENASGYEILRKPSYSEIYSSIGITYENSYIDYNISSGESYDYMVVEFSETGENKVYQNNWVSETVDCAVIRLYSETDTVNVGENIEINSYTYPETTAISWNSSDESVAIVDTNGVLTAIAPGEVTITAKLKNGLYDSYTITVVSAHTHEYTPVVTSPVCTENGYTTYTCSCGDSYIDEYVDSTGHTPGAWVVVKAAEAGKKGLEQQKCTVCGEVLNERDIPALPEMLFKPGDVNGDGSITAADARIVLRISAKLESIESYRLPVAVFDVTGDGQITAADARKVLRVSAKLETI